MVSIADLAAAARKASVVEIEIAGHKVHMRSFIGAEQRALIERNKAGDPMSATEIMAIGLCTPEGLPLMTVEEAEQFPGDEIVRVGKEIMRHSGMLPEAQDAAVKN